MNGSDILASKYAQAFVNVYSSKISEKDFFNILNVYSELCENTDILFLMDFAFIKDNPDFFIDKFVNRFSLIEEFKILLKLLIDSNRIVLFKKILEFIAWKYQDFTSKKYFKIFLSDELKDGQVEVIKRFLMKLTNSDIIYKYEVDKKLIAGIRALSTNYLWEYSVYSQLQSLKRTLIS